MENNQLLYTAKPADGIEQRQHRMLAALSKHLGLLCRAAKEAGIEEKEHYHWLKTDEKYKEAVHNVLEQVTDTVEDALFNLISKGNVTAIIFYLKTRGKHRGYAQHEEEAFSKWPYTVDATTETEDERKWRNSL